MLKYLLQILKKNYNKIVLIIIHFKKIKYELIFLLEELIIDILIIIV